MGEKTSQKERRKGRNKNCRRRGLKARRDKVSKEGSEAAGRRLKLERQESRRRDKAGDLRRNGQQVKLQEGRVL